MTNPTNFSGQNPGFLRNAADPYILHLTEEPYLISPAILKRDTDPRIQRKRNWFYPTLEFISFDGYTLKLLNSHRGQPYELTIGSEPDKLHVACNCGREAETLCLHAYKALEKLTWYGNSYFFKQFAPGGLVEIAKAYSKYFNLKKTDLGFSIEPKPELGTVYQLSDEKGWKDFKKALYLPGSDQSRPATKKNMALTYILLDTHRDTLFPFLLPCMGWLNKAGTDIKAFQHFISGTQKDYDAFLTDEQRALNRICYDMWQLAENLPGSLVTEPVVNEEKIKTLLGLWQTAIPLLQLESFRYTYCIYWKTDLKNKPQKRKLNKVEFGQETPRLQFQLFDRGDIFQLHLRVSVKGRLLMDFCSDHAFFIKDGETLYLLSSLKDAGIVECWNRCDNYITIFKEHFGTFEQEILNPLRENYSVERISRSSLRIANRKTQAHTKNSILGS